MIVYIQNPMNSTRKLLNYSFAKINDFGKTVGYKVNIQESMIFLYTNNDNIASYREKKSLGLQMLCQVCNADRERCPKSAGTKWFLSI